MDGDLKNEKGGKVLTLVALFLRMLDTLLRGRF